ncbi:MAG: DVUA0089 family protein [Planctomycetota bacterium]|nr:DVUA0089 family protein [Planctomycetota bacterium]
MQLNRVRVIGVVPMGLIGVGLCSVSALAIDWVEPRNNDASDVPLIAQEVVGEGELNSINGSLTGQPLLGLDFRDMYAFNVVNPTNFSAQVVASVPVPVLYLFDADGRGVLASQINPAFESNLPGFGRRATDGTESAVLNPGRYFIAIAGFGNIPVDSAGNPIFAFGTRTEVSGPDGTGGANPIAGWLNDGDTGSYRIEFTGSGGIPSVGSLPTLALGALVASRRRRS